MKLDRPIFVVGTGRCGSTIFHEIFTHHPEVAFLSGLCLLYPNRPTYNRWAMQLMDAPLVHRYARKKFRPAEHWPFWDHYVRGFSFPCRDLFAADVRPNEAERIARAFQQMLTARRRRLLVKLSGWPRIGFVAKIFPDARFVHVVRDGRAVANSLLNVDFWKGWGGPGQLGLEPLSGEEREEWLSSNQSFAVLAAIQWKRWMDAFEAAKRHISPEQYFEIKYEDFTADPVATFDEVLEFCGLKSSPRFDRRIRRFNVRSRNDKWRSHLTAEQQRHLNDSLQRHLERYAYESRIQYNAPTDRNAIAGPAIS